MAKLVEQINHSSVLPPGVKIERIYDRKDLIDLTTHTVLHNMVVGILLIVLLQWVFLGDLRSALIVGATIPFALFFAVIILVLRGESANLLSVGAIDFGLIVDATVIMVEAIFRRLSQTRYQSRAGAYSDDTVMGMKATRSYRLRPTSRSIFNPLPRSSSPRSCRHSRWASRAASSDRWRGLMPMLAGGLLATFTITGAQRDHPARAYPRTRPGSSKSSRDLPAGAELGDRQPQDRDGQRRRQVVTTIICVPSSGLEFLPKLEGQSMNPYHAAAVSLQEAAPMSTDAEADPQPSGVISVVPQHGRPDDSTDAPDSSMLNSSRRKPAGRWPDTDDKDVLTAGAGAVAGEIPRRQFNCRNICRDNVSRRCRREENSIKLYGSGLQALTDTANRSSRCWPPCRGVTDLAVFTSLGQPTVRSTSTGRGRRARIPGDINATIKVAVGVTAGDLYEPGSDRHFPIIVRLAPEYRKSAEAIQNLRIGVTNANGGITQIPLSEVASIKLISGAAYIYREQQERYLPIKFSVRDRDLGSAILEAQQKVNEQVQLPPGSRLEWVAIRQSAGRDQAAPIVVPISLALIAVLLWFNFGSAVDTALAMSVIPMAIFGGVLGLLITSTPFSVSAAIGFIALFGIAVMDGIIILSQYNLLIEEGMERIEAVIRTGELQMRPVLMTCVVAGVGLLPAALSEGIGSQVQKPLAVVVVTGMMLAPVVILVTLPVLISYFSRRRSP